MVCIKNRALNNFSHYSSLLPPLLYTGHWQGLQYGWKSCNTVIYSTPQDNRIICTLQPFLLSVAAAFIRSYSVCQPGRKVLMTAVKTFWLSHQCKPRSNSTVTPHTYGMYLTDICLSSLASLGVVPPVYLEWQICYQSNAVLLATQMAMGLLNCA